MRAAIVSLSAEPSDSATSRPCASKTTSAYSGVVDVGGTIGTLRPYPAVARVKRQGPPGWPAGLVMRSNGVTLIAAEWC
ncbi:hypothetical protein GCM10022287_03050 [Gryllotalpicola koreensis]|uniref:Uncharacterized protein n=1 Tax=Gryllotalpicola koreensis TaxID=993086 RepID=A0ABP7ZQV6_9MICO